LVFWGESVRVANWAMAGRTATPASKIATMIELRSRIEDILRHDNACGLYDAWRDAIVEVL
jgi:hypothetical protein